MEGESPTTDPLGIKKNAMLIKECQQEIGRMDVLVCGGCHSVFHFVEQFQEHRLTGQCTGNSSIREGNVNEPKSQVWAFLLWKNTQGKIKSSAKTAEKDNSWIMYQRWCRLDSHDRDTWIAAGRSVQAFTKISIAKMQEVKTAAPAGAIRRGRSLTGQADDGLEEGEIRSIKNQNSKITTIRKVVKSDMNSNQDDDKADDLDEDSEDEDDLDESESELDTEEEAELEEMQREAKRRHELKKNAVTTSKSTDKSSSENSDSKENKTTDSNSPKLVPTVNLSDPNLRKAKRSQKIPTDTDSKNTESEYIVEKILAKRFNPKRAPKACHEYLLKWEGYPHEQNTWEPIDHLESCKPLLEEFERNLARQKQKKAALAAAQQNKNIVTTIKKTVVTPIITPASGRPARTSKIKAMGQVKAWCGTMNEDETGKRRISDSDGEDDPLEKKPKRDDGSWSGGTNTVTQKTQQPVLKAGVAAKPSIPGQRPILTPQKRPVGQPTLRVVQRKPIGTPGKQTIGATVSPQDRTGKGLLPEIKVKAKESKLMPGNSVHMEFHVESESSDDELPDPFPKDLPPPSPESPPRPLTLCPLTGKVLGKAEGERTPEPSPPAVTEESNHQESTDSQEITIKEELPDETSQSSLPSAQSEQATTLASLVTSEDVSKPIDSATIQITPPASTNVGEMMLADGGELAADAPIMITGEDGTIYQVAGQDENGQTLLVAQGADGEQQCVYLAASGADGESVLALDTSGISEDGVTRLVSDDQANAVEQPLVVDTEMGGAVDDSQVVAQVVKAELPSPGGTRKVVLLLPNGTLAVTTVNADQYSALDLE